EAAQVLRATVAQRGHSTMLLDGVTGSGKTEVYFEAMATALASGRQVLLLLPEIALTQQFIERVERRFGVEPAQWHSAMRPRERDGHVRLDARHGEAELPPSHIIDMRKATPPAGSWLSEPLAEAVAETLNSGDQALLFLNRRGYAPLTLCRACGHRIDCPNCA